MSGGRGDESGGPPGESRARGDEGDGPRGGRGSPRGEGPGGDRARLFVALTLEADVCARLAGWARATLGGEPGARLLDPETLHLTLCFLGAVELDAVDAISAALAEVVGGRAGDPLMFSVTEVRWLPPRRPRVCAVALRDPAGRAAALQTALAERLAGGGWYAPERRGWLPHVTVARVGRRGPVRRSRDARSGVARDDSGGRAGNPAPPALEPFPATAVALMRSWPGSRYETLARIAL